MVEAGQKFHDGFSLQPGLYPAGQCFEVGDSLQLVVWKFNVEVMLQPGEQVQRLQTVNPESLEEVVVGSELLARDFELRRRKIEYLFKSSLGICHG